MERSLSAGATEPGAQMSCAGKGVPGIFYLEVLFREGGFGPVVFSDGEESL